MSYGLSTNPEAIIDQPAMFDFYHGGGLDLAVLPMIQVDALGDVNVTRYGRTIKGCGSFVDISQSARRLVFVGSHAVGGLTSLGGGVASVRREGRPRRFVEQVDQISFSADQARRRGQEVLYVTERATFRLGAEGLELMEVAPGLDVERDVLSTMAFAPRLVTTPVPSMAAALFHQGPMGWRPEPKEEV